MVRGLEVATGKRTRQIIIRPGDKVAAPWGFEEIIGVVREVYGPAGHRHAFVRIPVHGCLGETIDEYDMTFQLKELRLVTPASATSKASAPSGT